tara:strand:+ start:125 stop:301 length:177 start_codon:yes stop_codon:yes gene_type:complete
MILEIISFGVGFFFGIKLMKYQENTEHKKELDQLHKKYIDCYDYHFKNINSTKINQKK